MTKPIRISLIVAASVLATGAVWWRHAWLAQAAVQSSEASGASAVGAEVRRLSAEVAELRRARPPRMDTSERPSTETASAREAQPTEAEKLAAGDKADIDRVIKLTKRLDEEPVDVTWSGQAEAQIKAAFRANAPAANIAEARCGRTLCRVVVNHQEGDPSMNAPMALVDALSLDDGLYFFHEPTKVTMFVLRKNHQPEDTQHL